MSNLDPFLDRGKKSQPSDYKKRLCLERHCWERAKMINAEVAGLGFVLRGEGVQTVKGGFIKRVGSARGHTRTFSPMKEAHFLCIGGASEIWGCQ